VYFDNLKLLGVNYERDWQIDRRLYERTDILIANAALRYVVRPKKVECWTVGEERVLYLFSE